MTEDEAEGRDAQPWLAWTASPAPRLAERDGEADPEGRREGEEDAVAAASGSAPPFPEEAADATPAPVPSPGASCAVCRLRVPGAEPRAAQYVCLACGKSVCSGHHWVMLGVCRACASEEDVRALRSGEGPQRFKELLGIKWVE